MMKFVIVILMNCDIHLIFKKNAYDVCRTKILTFLGFIFALFLYLYSQQGDLFIPGDVASKIFYFIGLSCLIAAIVLVVIKNFR